MGTRNLTIVKLKGKIKVAQYGQWDGYPTGQGETVAEFIRNIQIREFKKHLAKLEFVDDDYVAGLWNELTKRDDGTASLADSDKFKLKYPEFHRDTGANILSLISRGSVTKLGNSIDFLKDGLFCEYAYEINMDDKTVKVYVSGQEYKTYTFKEFSKKGKMKEIENELKGCA